MTALYFNKNGIITITTMQKDHTINKTDLKLGTSECCDLNGTFLRKSGQYVQRREKTATTHAKKRKPLTIGTLAPLHRSLSQQCTSQVLTSYPRPSTNFAVRNLCTILNKVIDGCAVIFCFNMGFYTGLRVWRTRRIVIINTVSPALLWATLVALDTVSYKWKQKFSFSFFCCCCFVFSLFFYGISSESFTASILRFQELHLGIPWKFNPLEFPEIARNKRCWWRRKSEIAEIPAHFRRLSPRTQKN